MSRVLNALLRVAVFVITFVMVVIIMTLAECGASGEEARMPSPPTLCNYSNQS